MKHDQENGVDKGKRDRDEDFTPFIGPFWDEFFSQSPKSPPQRTTASDCNHPLAGSGYQGRIYECAKGADDSGA